MGAGGRKDPSAIRIADIADTYHCALAKAVRLRLRKEGISKGLKTVFSTEQADRNAVVVVEGERNKKSPSGQFLICRQSSGVIWRGMSLEN